MNRLNLNQSKHLRGLAVHNIRKVRRRNFLHLLQHLCAEPDWVYWHKALLHHLEKQKNPLTNMPFQRQSIQYYPIKAS